MVGKKQEENITKRILITLKLFYENKGRINDEQLARLVSMEGIGTSSSTVGRDLTSNRLKKLIPENEYEEIQRLRNQNKELGKSLGGKNFAFYNDCTRNESGQFTGSKKR